MIELRNVTKQFNTGDKEIKAVKDLSLKINRGEIYGIIGLSGAGKSTLIRCINRLEEPTSGEVIIDGVNLTSLDKEELRQERKNIGMIFQHFNLLNQKTVFENIAFPLRLTNRNKDEIEKRVDELLQYVDLVDKKYDYPSQLSGGQKQRVAIARAIATNPKVLLSDEATSALDPQTTRSILEILKNIRDKFNITIVMITHQMEVVKEICDKVAIMEGGEIIEENTVEALFSNPKTQTAKNFINAMGSDIQEEIINPGEFTGKIFRLSFIGDSANKPFISRLSREFDIDINILSGNINKLQSTNIGHLMVEFLGDQDEIDRAISLLEENNVYVEVI